MDAEIELKEKKLIERYGKESWEKRLNNFYKRCHKGATYEYARKTLILGLSKFISEATPSTIIKD